MTERLTIGQLADRAGVSVETIRYYERRALLSEPARTRSGYRQYDAAAIRRIAFIKRAQELGFTLDEIAALLELRIDHVDNCDAVERRAHETVARIDRKIAELMRMREALEPLLAACRERRPTQDCPILDALDPEGDVSVDGKH